MVRFPHVIIVLVFAFAAVTAVALAAAMTPQQTIHNMVGTWSCVTHDSTHKTWRETDVDAMYGSWLRMTSTYPAQNGEHAGTGVGFFGYDSKHARWIVTSLDTSGDYGISYSTSHTFNGAHWLDGYPANHGSATTRMSSSKQFTVDSSGPDAHGHTVTSHEVCTRT